MILHHLYTFMYTIVIFWGDHAHTFNVHGQIYVFYEEVTIGEDNRWTEANEDVTYL